MPNQVPEEIKAERLQVLQELLRQQAFDFNKSCVGKEIDLLLEKRARHEGDLIGRSPWLQSVVVKGDLSEIGHTLRVRVTKAGPGSLNAERI